MAGFTAAQAPRLKVKWAFGFPGELSSDSQPTIAGGRVFAGTQSGVVYSLSAATGCVHWFFQADAAVRAAVSIGRIQTDSGPRYVAFIGDRAASVYALDAATGQLVWKTKVDNHPFARVTGSPRNASASPLSFLRISAEISSGRRDRPWRSMVTGPAAPPESG